MSPVKARLLRRLRILPPERLEEVSAFVDLLLAECERDVALQKIIESEEALQVTAGDHCACVGSERDADCSSESGHARRPFNLSAVIWMTF